MIRTWYCQWVTCGHHFDAHHVDALPHRCPTCHNEGWWARDPPPFDARLTDQDRRWLKSGLKDAHLGAREET